MNIYHFSYCPYFMGNSMVMLSFEGCNFQCKGCLRKKSQGNIYADENSKENRYLETWNFKEILKRLYSLKRDRIWLGGFEATVDKDLLSIIRELSKLDVYLALATNGSLIDKEYAKKLKEAGINLIFLSIKSFDEEKFRFYTGQSNKNSLKAIEIVSAMENNEFKLEIETTLLPGINDPKNIENLAVYISNINPSIELFIQPYIPSPENSDYREPKKEELIDAVTRAMKHLYIVSHHPLYSEIQEIRKLPKRAKFINFFPK